MVLVWGATAWTSGVGRGARRATYGPRRQRRPSIGQASTKLATHPISGEDGGPRKVLYLGERSLCVV